MDFGNAEIRTVDSRKYETELFISYCKDIEVINSHFFLTCFTTNWGTLFARESDGVEIGAAGRVGGGPGEYITPLYTGRSEKGDSIYLYDFSKRVLLMYKVDCFPDTVECYYTNKIEQQSGHFYEQLRRLKNGYYVGLRWEAEASAQLLTLLDAQLNEVKTFGSSPLPLERDFADFKNCYSNTRVTVYGNSVFIAVARFGYIAGYDISSQGDVSTRFEKMLVKPSYRKAGGIIFNAENREGFYDITASKHYLFAVYGGKTLDQRNPADGTGLEPETFAVFNHDGSLIARVKMNSMGFRLAVSEDEKRLYFCMKNPEFGIEEYKVSDLVK